MKELRKIVASTILFLLVSSTTHAQHSIKNRWNIKASLSFNRYNTFDFPYSKSFLHWTEQSKKKEYGKEFTPNLRAEFHYGVLD
ncbi:MAG: hypothetical protein LBR36_07345 [Bacteroidales bacterium]|jgi:hypothetical protein|nr:hypothetical protein [Bacteroidales bacterium]